MSKEQVMGVLRKSAMRRFEVEVQKKHPEIADSFQVHELGALLGDPVSWCAACVAGGMSRSEAESAARAVFVETWGTEDVLLDTMIAGGLAEEEVFEALVYPIGDALDSAYGPKEPGIDAIAKYATSRMSTLRRAAENLQQVPLSRFDGCMAAGLGLGIMQDVSPTDVGDGGAGYLIETWDPWRVDSMRAIHVRKKRTREVVQMGGLGFPHCVSLALAVFGRNGSGTVGEILLGSMSGAPHSWRTVVKRKTAAIPPAFQSQVQACLGLQLSLRYEWVASVRFDDGPLVGLPIGPHDAKDLFRLREIEDGANRRAALLHWVKGHRRRRPHTERDTVEVRQFLRGREKFKWFGCEGEIRAPQFDRERVAK